MILDTYSLFINLFHGKRLTRRYVSGLINSPKTALTKNIGRYDILFFNWRYAKKEYVKNFKRYTQNHVLCCGWAQNHNHIDDKFKRNLNHAENKDPKINHKKRSPKSLFETTVNCANLSILVWLIVLEVCPDLEFLSKYLIDPWDIASLKLRGLIITLKIAQLVREAVL